MVTHLLKARTVEPEKQPLLGNVHNTHAKIDELSETGCNVYNRCYGTIS
jgi:hypothetical protein